MMRGNGIQRKMTKAAMQLHKDLGKSSTQSSIWRQSKDRIQKGDAARKYDGINRESMPMNVMRKEVYKMGNKGTKPQKQAGIQGVKICTYMSSV